MADGAGAASGPLRRRLRWPRDQQQPGSVPARRETEPSEEPPSHRVPGGLERDILALYLSDHLTEATARVELMRSAVAGKLGGWETLAHLAPDLGLPPGVFTGLADRALEQLNLLERIHETVASTAFRLGPKAT